MRVGLVSMRWCDFGGWPTYTRHLYTGLQQAGHEPTVLTDGKVMSGWKGVMNFAPIDNLEEYDKLIVVVFAPDAEVSAKIRGKIDAMVLHDPTEWRRKAAKRLICKLEPPQLIFIRDKPLRTFLNAGFYRLARTDFIPHPYARMCDKHAPTDRVICTARVDHDKRTHLIVKADRGVELWTGYINWVYDQERFDSSLKKQAFYKGAFGFKREDIANVYDGACALVDMSIIAGDGGGTQYTFLEAIDFGADCILASDWYAGPRSEMKPGVHYHQVGNVKELQGAIDKVRHGGPVLQCAAKDILVSHDAEQIARQYIELL